MVDRLQHEAALVKGAVAMIKCVRDGSADFQLPSSWWMGGKRGGFPSLYGGKLRLAHGLILGLDSQGV